MKGITYFIIYFNIYLLIGTIYIIAKFYIMKNKVKKILEEKRSSKYESYIFCIAIIICVLTWPIDIIIEIYDWLKKNKC